MIPNIWDQVEPLITRALDQGSNYDIDEIWEGLRNGQLQLWLANDGKKIQAALVTAIQTEKKTKFCLLLALGGEDMDHWIQHIEQIQDWARDHNCKEMRIYGRRGWARKLGFDIQWTLMSKEI